MRDNHCRNEGAERHDDHADHFRADLLEELLKVYKNKACHHGCYYLSLITDHFNLRESEIPYRNLISRR